MSLTRRLTMADAYIFEFGEENENGERRHFVESKLKVGLAKLQARKAVPALIALVCGYGCGKLHRLNDYDYNDVIEVFPSYEQPKADADNE
ncbi:unnamed protein product [Sphagnum jensenii]|uniref:Uncharacterized protein n=1 Tax=Sphagnum jensenii TaxID=128206 RepID=A0ABP0V9Z5_9BRYO